MDRNAILSELEQHRDRLNSAIQALTGRGRGQARQYGGMRRAGPQPRRKLSAAVRRRMGDAMRKRWKERRAAGKNTL